MVISLRTSPPSYSRSNKEVELELICVTIRDSNNKLSFRLKFLAIFAGRENGTTGNRIIYVCKHILELFFKRFRNKEI
jgi:hypothetical protein